MKLNNKILSDITIFNKYAKYIPELKRRETWTEICDRYQNTMIQQYPPLKEDIIENTKYIRNFKVLPSMRMLQFAGDAVFKNHARGYNCSYCPVDNYKVFSEAMFLLLSGCGFGYSVQFQHIDKLNEIKKPTKYRKFLIADNIEGWSDAIKELIKSFLGVTEYQPKFDFSDIRAKGMRLVTSGGKAPGPQPLKECLIKIEGILNEKENGDKLSPLECHDILCHIANSVLAGGIRRAAMISFFSFDDEEMLKCKFGNWWELNEQRGRANNSAVVLRHRVTESDFLNLWNKVEASNSGEPGIYFTNNPNVLANPCVEKSLEPNNFCNLCEINGATVESQEDFNKRCEVAAFFGTLQAGFSDFHYLRPIWKHTTEKHRLLGVSITGVATARLLELNEKEGAEIVKETNSVISKIIGINKASRCTTLKPAGTTSLVLGTSSGIHAWHNDFYLRRMRLNKIDPLYKYLVNKVPELIEDDLLQYNTAILSVPQSAPDGAITRNESPMELLERVKRFNLNWVRNGHRKGDNFNNVSATISIKEDEWKDIGQWMWENRNNYQGLSVLPFDNGTYIQAPFEDISFEEYSRLERFLKNIDLTEVIEEDDETSHTQEAACSNGLCEL